MGRRSVLTPSESLADGLAKIEAGLETGAKAPLNPDSLTIRQLYTMVAVFQPRKLDGRLAEDEAHIRALMDAIGTPDKPRVLDPLTVWWGGSLGWMLVDGFHRAEAYKRLGLNDLPVPVTVFSGTLAQAMAHAAACNSKDKLAMRKDDKLDMAWRLVLTSPLSKAQIADACKVAPRTVANMRAKVKEVDGRLSRFVLAEKSWKHVAKLSAEELVSGSRKPVSDDEIEEKIERTAEQWAKRICKTLGAQPMLNPEAFARALEIIEQRLPTMLMETEAWSEHFSQLSEALLEEGLEEFEESEEEQEPRGLNEC